MTTLDRVNSTTRGTGSSTNAGQPFHAKRMQAGLSTQIVIQVQADDGQRYTIGAVQSLRADEKRSISEIYEIGTDSIIQLVPKSATTYSLNIDRIVFDFQRLPQALQREYRHIHAQRHPFDIIVKDYNPYIQDGQKTAPAPSPTPASRTAMETVYGNCWFESLDVTYTQNDYIITERCSLKCEYVYDQTAPGMLATSTDTLEKQSSLDPSNSIMSAFDSTALD